MQVVQTLHQYLQVVMHLYSTIYKQVNLLEFSHVQLQCVYARINSIALLAVIVEIHQHKLHYLHTMTLEVQMYDLQNIIIVYIDNYR